MLRAMFYGLTHGVVSGRKLCEVCRNDNRFIVLSGNLRPDRRTFDRFIRRHEERFSGLFVQVVRLAQKMGLVSLGRVALDGSKFKAAADKDMRYEKMGRALGYIENNLKQLKKDLAQANTDEATELESKITKELKDQTIRRDRIATAKAAIEADFATRKKKSSSERKEKAKKALVDPEALSLWKRGGGYMHGYNAQAAVDDKAQIVVAATLEDSATDYGALPALVDQVQENCGKHPQAYLADSGYQSVDNLKKVTEVGSQALVCRKASRTKDPLEEEIHEQLTKGSHDREYFCKDGRRLDLASRRKDGYLSFRMKADFCQGCSQQNNCHFFGKKHPEVLDDQDRELYKTFLAFSRTEEWKETYKRRKVIVEPVFGNIKNKGIRIFVRGKQAVSTWWNIATTAHNIEKMVGHLAQQPQRLGSIFSTLFQSLTLWGPRNETFTAPSYRT